MIDLLVFAVSCLLSWWFASARSPFQIHDRPNERSLHEHPVPRTGGMAILAGIAFGWGWLAFSHGLPATILWILTAAVLVAGISVLDDIFDLSPIVRLAVHLIAAGVLVMGGLGLFSGWFGVLITVLGIVWMLNLYNFMDGMDGFAGGMTVAGFAFLGVAGWWGGAQAYALYCWTVGASVLGFLLLNFPPARIFMGDAGSATLGLLAAAFSLWGIHGGLFPIWFPLLIFSPFIVDATVTLLRRAWRKEKVWLAHRTHYYQRLVQAGWGHRKTVMVEYALMLGAGSSAMLLMLYPNWWFAGLITWCVFYILLACAADTYCVKQKGGVI